MERTLFEDLSRHYQLEKDREEVKGGGGVAEWKRVPLLEEGKPRFNPLHAQDTLLAWILLSTEGSGGLPSSPRASKQLDFLSFSPGGFRLVNVAGHKEIPPIRALTVCDV